jgi:hypothetical protein
MNLHSLILHRTSREQSNKGITVMARGGRNPSYRPAREKLS